MVFERSSRLARATWEYLGEGYLGNFEAGQPPDGLYSCKRLCTGHATPVHFWSRSTTCWRPPDRTSALPPLTRLLVMTCRVVLMFY
ncbi:hypothetical protein MRX96_027672 [Rhipicephalus microplus]